MEKCRYCDEPEIKGSGWGLCLEHAQQDEQEDHSRCRGCDDCQPYRLGEDPWSKRGVS